MTTYIDHIADDGKCMEGADKIDMTFQVKGFHSKGCLIKEVQLVVRKQPHTMFAVNKDILEDIILGHPVTTDDIMLDISSFIGVQAFITSYIKDISIRGQSTDRAFQIGNDTYEIIAVGRKGISSCRGAHKETVVFSLGNIINSIELTIGTGIKGTQTITVETI